MYSSIFTSEFFHRISCVLESQLLFFLCVANSSLDDIPKASLLANLYNLVVCHNNTLARTYTEEVFWQVRALSSWGFGTLANQETKAKIPIRSCYFYLWPSHQVKGCNHNVTHVPMGSFDFLLAFYGCFYSFPQPLPYKFTDAWKSRKYLEVTNQT